jgi:predicted small lipoprotein YifL
MKHFVLPAAALLFFATLAACGKKDAEVKSDARVKAERDAATRATRDNAVVGDQLKQIDKAKELGGQLNNQAADNVRKAEGN